MSVIQGISHPLINALGWTLLSALWQILAIALLWRLVMYMTRKASSALRYNLSLVALGAIPVASILTFVRQYRIYSEASPIVSLELPGAVYRTAATDSPFYLVPKDYPALLERFEAFTPWLFWFYLAGLVLLSLHSLISYSRLYSLKRRNLRPLPPALQRKLKALHERAGLQRMIRVAQSPNISVAAVVGFFKPVVLLPLSMLSSLSPEQVEAILLHELFHIRRHDHLVNMFQNLMEIVFFFHPATWWLSRHIRRERERCVDEWVVHHTGNPMIYARALVALEEKRSATLQPVVAASQSKVFLLTRIKNIMTMKTRPFNPGQRMAALLVILGATISVAWFNPSMTMNHAHADSDHYLETSLVPYYPQQDATEYTPQDQPPAVQAAPQQPQQAQPPATPPDKEPRTIHLKDGRHISWDELPEEERAALRKAMEEMRMELQQVNEELRETFNSEEFRQQMQQARAEIREAMKEIELEKEHFNSEEFRSEMREAREEVRRAMQEVEKEFNSEEFRQEMEEARREFRKAMEEMRRELEEEGYELKESENWNEEEYEAFRQQMQLTMEVLDSTMMEIGPIVRSAMESVNIEEILQEVFESLETIVPEEEEKK